LALTSAYGSRHVSQIFAPDDQYQVIMQVAAGARRCLLPLARDRGPSISARGRAPHCHFILASSASAAMNPNGIQFGPVMMRWKMVFASSLRPL